MINKQKREARSLVVIFVETRDYTYHRDMHTGLYVFELNEQK